MNAKRVAAAEGVILAAQKTKRTATGIAIALEAECLLQSPEIAEEQLALRTQVAELLAERHTTNEALSAAAEALRANRDRIAELEAHLGRDAEQRHLMDPLDHALGALAPRTVELGPHLFEAEHMGESDAKRRLPRCKECKNPATDPAHAADDRPEVRHLRALLNARRPAEDPHESPLRHDYAVSRDLPTTTIETSGSAL